jgi:hypothetical protein
MLGVEVWALQFEGWGWAFALIRITILKIQNSYLNVKQKVTGRADSPSFHT